MPKLKPSSLNYKKARSGRRSIKEESDLLLCNSSTNIENQSPISGRSGRKKVQKITQFLLGIKNPNFNQESIEESNNITKPRISASKNRSASTCKNTTQLYLNFGQKNAPGEPIFCKDCGMTYTKSDKSKYLSSSDRHSTLDDEWHNKIHLEYMCGVSVSNTAPFSHKITSTVAESIRWIAEYPLDCMKDRTGKKISKPVVGCPFGSDHTSIDIWCIEGKCLIGSKGQTEFTGFFKKISKMFEIMKKDLGSVDIPDIVLLRSKLFVAVAKKTRDVLQSNNERRIVGCLLAEPIKQAYLLPDDSQSVKHEDHKQHACCGVSRIWVSNYMRRRNIAFRLLDCMR